MSDLTTVPFQIMLKDGSRILRRLGNYINGYLSFSLDADDSGYPRKVEAEPRFL